MVESLVHIGSIDLTAVGKGEFFGGVVCRLEGIGPGTFKVQGVDERKDLTWVGREGWVEKTRSLLRNPFGHGIRCRLFGKVDRVGGSVELLRELFGKFILEREILLYPDGVCQLEDIALLGRIVVVIEFVELLVGGRNGFDPQRIGDLLCGLTFCTVSQHSKGIGKADGRIALVFRLTGQQQGGGFGAKLLKALDKLRVYLVFLQVFVFFLPIGWDLRLFDFTDGLFLLFAGCNRHIFIGEGAAGTGCADRSSKLFTGKNSESAIFFILTTSCKRK